MSQPIDTNVKTLLAISDIEGCKGSKILCSGKNYVKMKEYLSDENNNIVFLGDYFDQGSGMIESIINIGDLKESYQERVHIILGNRDINKFRLFYEAVTDLAKPDKKKIWSDWGNEIAKNNKSNPNYIFDNDSNTNIWEEEKDMIKKTKLLNKKTYGAAALLQNITTELNTKDKIINGIKIINEPPATDMDALYILCSMYVHEKTLNKYITKTDFIQNNNDGIIKIFQKYSRIIFYYGRLISMINIGERNVLMSHGGSYNRSIFNIDEQFYKNITFINNSNQKVENNNASEPVDIKKTDEPIKYFEKMEEVRKIFGKSISDANNNNNKVEDMQIKLNEINSIYIDFIDKIFDENTLITNTITPKSIDFVEFINGPNSISYFIINAMGLNKGGNEKEFFSPIASCGTINCGGLEKNKPDLIDFFIDNKIHYVLNGHVPHCTNVPIIYNRKGEKPRDENKVGFVVFVSCDTSNGRDGIPDEYEELDQLPLAYIQEKKVGIASINENGNLNSTNTKGFGYKLDDGKTEYFTDIEEPYKELIQTWDYENTPTLQDRGKFSILEFKYGENDYTLEPGVKGEKIPYKETFKGETEFTINYPKLVVTQKGTIQTAGKKSRRRKGKSGKVTKRRHKKRCKNMHCNRCG